MLILKKKFLSVLKYLLFLSIGIGLIWWQLSKMTEEEKQQFTSSLQNARYIYVLPIVIMGLLSHYFRALRWKLLIDPIGKVSASNAFYATLTGYFGNTFVPRAGEILRCTMLSRYGNLSFAKLLGTVIVERVFDMFTFVFFIFLTVVIQIPTVKTFISDALGRLEGSDSGWPVWINLGILITILLAGFFIVKWIFARFAHNKIIARVINLWQSLKEGLSTILHLKKRGAFLVYTLLIWGLYLMQIYVGFRTLDDTLGLGLPVAMSVLTLSTVAMIITPGGLGAFPVAVQQVLLIYNVDNLSFGWLVWGVNTGIIILAGLISFGLLMYQNKKNYETSRRDQEEDLQPTGT